MSSSQFHSISRDKFLVLAANLLHRALIEPARTEAKRVYRALAAGETVHLSTVQMENDSRAAFHLSLAHGEFCGSLNYSAFRASVAALIGNIARAVREEKELKVFNALNGGSAMIFGITAVTQVAGERNVMVLAADLRDDGEATVLQLMYLDPTQFAGVAVSAAGDADARAT